MDHGSKVKKVMFSIGYLHGGGAERIVSIWASYLARAGYEVMVLVSARSQNEYPVDAAVRICAAAKDSKTYLSQPYLQRIRAKRQYIKQFKPDVILSFLPKGQLRMMIYGFGIRARRIETVRINPWRVELGKVGKLLWKFVFWKSDAIILQTEDQKDYFGKATGKKCTVIRNTLSPRMLALQKTEYREHPCVYVSAGRLCEQKNFPMLIRAFACFAQERPEAELRIYGSGTQKYTAYLQQIICESGMERQIRLMGRTEDMGRCLLEADAFIMSSDFEGMPNALAEAMCLGLVCISTDCRTGPADMIVNGQNGCLTKTGSEEQMVLALEKVSAMTAAQQAQMGKNAARSIRQLCDAEENMKRLIQVIEG